MLEVFQNKCLRRILHIFGQQDNQCGAPRANWDPAHIVRSKEITMEWIGHVKQNTSDIYSKSSHALDPPETGGGDDQKRRGEGPWSER